MDALKPHATGSFCWVELGTTDAAAAKQFYGDLMGWQAEDVPMPEGVYSMMLLDGKPAAAMYQLTPEMREQGVPPHWMLYIAVEDADAMAEKIKENGGEVKMAPFDVMEHGRMAVCSDPQGAVFSIWQAKEHVGIMADPGPGTLGWSELATTDAEAAKTFYSNVFGYGLKTSPIGGIEYTELQIDGRSVGGLMEMTEEWKGVPPHWMPYFVVTGADATVQAASSKGADIKVPATDIPGVGRFSLIQDPQGAMFSIIQLSAGVAA